MPRISEFYGIEVYLYAREHGVPHFHARYAGAIVSVKIGDFEVMAGGLPNRQTRLLRRWAELHVDELMTNWRRVTGGTDPLPIRPLD